MTRKQLLVPVFLHVLDTTCIGGRHPQSTITALEMVMENQGSWRDGGYRFMDKDAPGTKYVVLDTTEARRSILFPFKQNLKSPGIVNSNSTGER